MPSPCARSIPANGWVEHDAGEIWQAALSCCRAVLKGCEAGDVAAIGITNQRETSLIWDRKTGAPLHNAIVWQDRRRAARCAQLKKRGLEPVITAQDRASARSLFLGHQAGMAAQAV